VTREERKIYEKTADIDPLDFNGMRYFEEIVSARADDIIAKWIDCSS